MASPLCCSPRPSPGAIAANRGEPWDPSGAHRGHPGRAPSVLPVAIAGSPWRSIRCSTVATAGSTCGRSPGARRSIRCSPWPPPGAMCGDRGEPWDPSGAHRGHCREPCGDRRGPGDPSGAHRGHCRAPCRDRRGPGDPSGAHRNHRRKQRGDRCFVAIAGSPGIHPVLTAATLGARRSIRCPPRPLPGGRRSIRCPLVHRRRQRDHRREPWDLSWVLTAATAGSPAIHPASTAAAGSPCDLHLVLLTAADRREQRDHPPGAPAIHLSFTAATAGSNATTAGSPAIHLSFTAATAGSNATTRGEPGDPPVLHRGDRREQRDHRWEPGDPPVLHRGHGREQRDHRGGARR